MQTLKIITSTTRPGRKGVAVARWIEELSNVSGLYDVELLDLAEINLPLLNEANHPRLKKYEHEHTRQWSAKIEAADAFIIVLAEYNFGFPAPIKNAIDYLYHEWRYKPVGFVSYGGASGGMRSLQMLKQVVTALNMMPLSDAASIPFFTKYFDDQENFRPEEPIEKAANAMLQDLSRWAASMKSLRS